MLLEIQKINFKIKNKSILKNINLSFENGFYVLLGLNGAGKTTLMKILSTIYKPSSGKMIYKDKSVIEKSVFYKKNISFMSQNIGLIQDFTVQQNLLYFGLLKGCNIKELRIKINDILNNLNLTPFKNFKIINLSGGTKQKIGIALALLNSPKILILDEPINNLDKYERDKFYNLLHKISKNSIVILSTHLINEIEIFCDKVIFMKDGKISYFGKIKNSFKSINYSIKTKEIPNSIDLKVLSEKHKIINLVKKQDSFKMRYFTKKDDETFTLKPTFEDSFIYYTKYFNNDN